MTQVWSMNRQSCADLAAYVANLAARRGDVPEELLPTESEIAQMVESAYWATLRLDEGRYPKFSLLFSPPEHCHDVLVFEPRPLTSLAIAALAPALVPRVTRLGIRRSTTGPLEIWGLAMDVTTCLEVRGIAPTRLTVQLSYDHLAIFERETCELLLVKDPDSGDEHGVGRPQCAAITAGCFATTLAPVRRGIVGVLLSMIVDGMRDHGHGGTVLVVSNAEDQALALLDLGRQRVTGGHGLAEAVDYFERKAQEAGGTDEDPWAGITKVPELDHYLRGHVHSLDPSMHLITDALGKLTAIDGALLLTERLEILSFGAIVRAAPDPTRDRIVRRSFLEYARSVGGGTEVEIASVGGTRRQSAARFVRYSTNGLALTASHDGPLTIAMWVQKEAGADNPRAHLMTHVEYLLD